MSKYSIIVVVGIVAICSEGVLGQDDEYLGDVRLQDIFRYPRAFNQTSRQSALAPTVVNMNGNYNYQAAQQVFFINAVPDAWSKGSKRCVNYLKRDDYVIKPGIGAYKFHRRKVKWNQARKSCQDEGGQLVVINSVNEENILQGYIKQENVDRIWLGVHDLFEEGDWVTLNGDPIETTGYEKWSTSPWPNQPDNYGGRQNCGMLIKEGGMDDNECDILHPYVCEIALC